MAADLHKFLVALRGDTHAAAAGDFLLRLLKPQRAEVVLLYVDNEWRGKGEEYLRDLAKRFNDRGIKCDFRKELARDAGKAICAVAEDISADVVVVAARGLTGLKKAFIKSVSTYVVRHCHSSVLVLKPLAEHAAWLASLANRPLGFMCCVDQHHWSHYAFNTAVTALAREHDDVYTMTVVKAASEDKTEKDLHHEFVVKTRLETYEGMAKAYGVAFHTRMATVTEASNAKVAICRKVADGKDNIDILVLGHRGLSKHEELKLGSVGVHCVHKANVPAVLIVREPVIEDIDVAQRDFVRINEFRKKRLAELKLQSSSSHLPEPTPGVMRWDDFSSYSSSTEKLGDSGHSLSMECDGSTDEENFLRFLVEYEPGTSSSAGARRHVFFLPKSVTII